MPGALTAAWVPLLISAGGMIAIGRFHLPALVWWAAVAGYGIAVAGQAVRRRAAMGAGGGRTDLLIFAALLLGVVAAMLVSGTAVLLGLVAFSSICLLAALDRRGLPNHLPVALLTGFPFMYGAVAAGHPAEGALPWTFAAWIALVSELVGTVERDAPGKNRQRLTLSAAALSLALIPVSLIWPARAGYHGAYFLVALFAELFLLAVATRLLVGRTDRLSRMVRGAMVLGFIALLLGRVGWGVLGWG